MRSQLNDSTILRFNFSDYFLRIAMVLLLVINNLLVINRGLLWRTTVKNNFTSHLRNILIYRSGISVTYQHRNIIWSDITL